jgi:hypothetical protein
MPSPLKFGHILLGFGSENNIFLQNEEQDRQIANWRQQIRELDKYLTHLRNSKKVLQQHMKGDLSSNVVGMRNKTKKEISTALKKMEDLRLKIKNRRKIEK